ncbi:diguanylate cyclase [Butyrivibrio sp. DSM 10294]|uniref:sensor domain-containing diguanylate cyclase n=1 Tax=Butyrivibrio sp. DSM 10294 TaxID=2972457 RepID=UPI00234E514E|nr:diguanylate cyclase [Butyrivibrio sp. DSM 10294]MDC7295032.1 diguanylate cyclase [Butyrivibrio sp. DSM 10294]
MVKQAKDKGPIIAFATGIILVTTVIIAVFYSLYNVSRQNMINLWNNNAIQMFRDVEFYLDTPRDAVIFASEQVEHMIDNRQSNEEIQAFLQEESEVFTSVVDSNNRGVYGYIRGEYLDGADWDPPADFSPSKRPWYTEAKAAGGEITFVKPYHNLQQNNMVLSVSKLLDDGQSVISMDISLDGIQELQASQQEANKVDATMIVDKSGMIVSHSNETKVGKNVFLNAADEYDKRLISSVLNHEEEVFTINGRNGREIVFCRQLNKSWYSVLVLSEKEVLGNIKYIFVISAVVLALLLIVFTVIISVYLRKHREAGELHGEIGAIADVYSTMEIMDLKKGSVKSIRNKLIKEGVFAEGNNKIVATKEEIAELIAAEVSKPLLEQFMDLETLPERIRGLNNISHEFLDREGKWVRMHFIVVSRDSNDNPEKIILAIESIDEDRKRQEMFKRMSETDKLTNILNRSGGESRIYELMHDGICGMVFLFDADHFKYVNDTYGHDMGDKVIITLAHTLRDNFRDSDVVFRMGGDEFVAYAAGANSNELGKIVMDRLFANLDKVSIEGMTDWKLQVSAGAAICSDPEHESFSDILQRADKAMYESKQHEGNYITFADSSSLRA